MSTRLLSRLWIAIASRAPFRMQDLNGGMKRVPGQQGASRATLDQEAVWPGV